jgi:hypothetical protein
MKHRLIEFTKVVFSDVEKENYEFQGQFASLNLHLSDFIQVPFFDAQGVENDFAWPFDIFKHHYIDFTKVFFKTSRRQIIRSQGHSPT